MTTIRDVETVGTRSSLVTDRWADRLRRLWRSSQRGKPRPARTRTVDPARLSPADKERLADTLLPIFEGLLSAFDREFFVSHVLFPDCSLSRLRLLYDERGREIGFAVGWVVEVETANGRLAVLRGAVFADLAYRCAPDLDVVLARTTLSYLRRHPLRPFWALGLAVHAASYVHLASHAKRGVEVYPNRHHTPPWVSELASELTAAFGMQAMGEDPWVVRMPVGIVDTERLRRSQRLIDDPNARYYWQLVDPHGSDAIVVVLAPVSPRNIAVGLSSLARTLVRRPSGRGVRRQRST